MKSYQGKHFLKDNALIIRDDKNSEHVRSCQDHGNSISFLGHKSCCRNDEKGEREELCLKSGLGEL